MLLLQITMLTVASVARLAPSSVKTPSAAVCIVEDSQSVLSVDALVHMTTFWTSFTRLPDSIKTTGRKANQESLPLSGGQQQITLPGVVNMVAMATKYPVVAAALKQSNLTPQEWEGYRAALLTALLVQQTGIASSIPATSILAKNVAFLAAHQQEFSALKATGMWLPNFQMQGSGGGGGGGDLDP